MNSLLESAYALRILWSYIKCLFYKYNLGCLILPVIYLFVILIAVPSTEVVVNEITHTTLNTYNTITVTKDYKIEYILDKYNLTKEQFNVLSAIVLTEAETNSYEDAYAVINTIYNRAHSKNWVRSVDNRYGKGKGENLYYQAISPNQFVVYQHGTYKRNLNNTNSVSYDAVIDFLYTEDEMHNYLSFRSNGSYVKNYEVFSENGNKYFNELRIENRI